MKLIVGLGNTGTRYEKTRHNIGFRVVDSLALSLNISLKHGKYDALVANGILCETSILLVKPTTMMNNSGIAIQKLVRFYRIPPEDILVVVDDYYLDIGNVRFRIKGSAGGHNGVRSIIQHLGTQDFPRLRIGVGMVSQRDMADFVLSKFSPGEKKIVEETIETACNVVEMWLTHGHEAIMQRYNRKNG